MKEIVEAGKPIHVCLLAESSDDAALLATALETSDEFLRVRHISSKNGLCKAIEIDECDIVVGVPQSKRFGAYKALAVLSELKKNTPVIGISKKNTKVTVIDAMKN